MKSKVLQGVFLFYVLTLVSACNTKTTEQTTVAVDTAAIKSEIQAKENEFAELFNTNQVKNIGYYAEDAVSYSQNRPPLVGKAAVVAYLSENLDSFTKAKSKISFTTNEVFVSDGGNQVVEIGYFKVVSVEDSILNSGNYMSLFVKRDGKYVSLRDMSVSDISGE